MSERTVAHLTWGLEIKSFHTLKRAWVSQPFSGLSEAPLSLSLYLSGSQSYIRFNNESIESIKCWKIIFIQMIPILAILYMYMLNFCVYFFYISQDSTCTVERPDVSTVLGFVAIVIAIEYTQQAVQRNKDSMLLIYFISPCLSLLFM